MPFMFSGNGVVKKDKKCFDLLPFMCFRLGVDKANPELF